MHVVIVAEDEPLIRMMIKDVLIEQGFRVLEAEHAAAVLDILEIEAMGVHVLFTDVQMPGDMDGLALSHHVKSHWPWIGLLVTSAHATLTEDELPVGSRFLPKPYFHGYVIEHVRALIEAV
jgi:CheY-like chemotaxis protein